MKSGSQLKDMAFATKVLVGLVISELRGQTKINKWNGQFNESCFNIEIGRFCLRISISHVVHQNP
jgi:hypothetical protein